MEVLIVSGNGAVYVNKLSLASYKLGPDHAMPGTMISLRVEDRAKIVNVYQYAEGGRNKVISGK